MSLEHVFDEMEISADPFALCELHGRCSMRLGCLPSSTLHYVLGGRGELACRGRRPITMARGTLVLVPASHPHTLRSFGGDGHSLPNCYPAELNLAVHLRDAQNGAGRSTESDSGAGKLLSICSSIKISIRGTKGLVDLVREPIVTMIGDDDAIQGPVDRLLVELCAPKLGSRAMVRALLLECMTKPVSMSSSSPVNIAAKRFFSPIWIQPLSWERRSTSWPTGPA